MFIRNTILSASIVLMTGLNPVQASVQPMIISASDASLQTSYLVAKTNTKKRRDNRQDDRGRSDDREERRDCRDDEGVVGKDKRDCKQDSRKGENDKDKDKD